jgi:hypothetical protein
MPEKKYKYPDQLDAWCVEEIAAFKAKGATEEDTKEPAFAHLVLKTVLEKHADEIRADPELEEAVFKLSFEEASPSELRKMAEQQRAEWRTRLRIAHGQIVGIPGTQHRLNGLGLEGAAQ